MEVKEIRDKAYDFSNRWHLITQVGTMIGLEQNDLTTLLFLFAGNPQNTNPPLPDILKRFKLPKVNVDYSMEKLEKYIKFIDRAIEQWESASVFNMKTLTFEKFGNMNMITTPFGIEMAEIVYRSVRNQLKNSPSYIISIIAGVYLALQKTLKFLGVDLNKLEATT